METGAAFKSFYDIVVRLRGPDGCPWDREQTPESLRDDLTEETYECIEAIDEKDSSHIREELGDLFLLVTMIAYMYEQEGIFSVSDVLAAVSEKLIRRHPHVFGSVKFNNSAEVLVNWAKIKTEQEGRGAKDSILDEVSAGIPPLERAAKLQKKAAKAGFDWPDSDGVRAKILEELDEVRTAADRLAQVQDAGAQNAGADADAQEDVQVSANETALPAEKLEEELGDLLFSVVNLCRFYKVEPSIALARTNSKFIKRFKYVEKMMKANNQEMKKENLDIMDTLWNEAKEN
jgi:tetrapyrrole methylase family protein/MazG family protein